MLQLLLSESKVLDGGRSLVVDELKAEFKVAELELKFTDVNSKCFSSRFSEGSLRQSS